MARYVSESEVKTKSEWFKWFETNGNHGSDGWVKADDWFEDMLRCGLIREDK